MFGWSSLTTARTSRRKRARRLSAPGRSPPETDLHRQLLLVPVVLDAEDGRHAAAAEEGEDRVVPDLVARLGLARRRELPRELDDGDLREGVLVLVVVVVVELPAGEELLDRLRRLVLRVHGAGAVRVADAYGEELLDGDLRGGGVSVGRGGRGLGVQIGRNVQRPSEAGAGAGGGGGSAAVARRAAEALTGDGVLAGGGGVRDAGVGAGVFAGGGGVLPIPVLAPLAGPIRPEEGVSRPVGGAGVFVPARMPGVVLASELVRPPVRSLGGRALATCASFSRSTRPRATRSCGKVPRTPFFRVISTYSK